MNRGLFPTGVAFVEASAEMWETPAASEEEQALGHAVDKRRREFRAGRHCAREALRRIGIPAAVIPVGFERRPIWPSGVVGSIAHTRGYCAAAVTASAAVAGIGFDAERRGAVGSSLAPEICTARELRRLARLDARDGLTIAFAAKESLHKCVNPATGVELDFHEAEVDLDPARSEFTIAVVGAGSLPGMVLQGRYAVHGDHVLAGLMLPAGTLP